MIWTWLIRAQAFQILWDSVYIITHALNNLCRPYGRQLNDYIMTVSVDSFNSACVTAGVVRQK